MDSAEARSIQGVLENNNARMDRQEEQMFATGRAVQALVAQVSELTTQIQHLRMPAAPPPPAGSLSASEQLYSTWAAAADTGSLQGWAQSVSSLPCKMLYVFFSATADVRHRGVQGGVGSHAAVWKGCVMGNGGVGESSSLLFLVPRTIRGDEEGLRPRGSRARGGAQAGRSPPGWKICLGLFHRVPNPGGGVQVERGGAVGHVPAWVGWPDSGGDV